MACGSRSFSSRRLGLASADPFHIHDVLSEGWTIHSVGPALAEFTLWEEGWGGHTQRVRGNLNSEQGPLTGLRRKGSLPRGSTEPEG